MVCMRAHGAAHIGPFEIQNFISNTNIHVHTKRHLFISKLKKKKSHQSEFEFLFDAYSIVCDVEMF